MAQYRIIEQVMSHLTCPLCGLNVPLSRFEDSDVNLDLRLVSFRGLGRGKGFSVEEENSILGDDFYSPLVAERMLSLLEMFINENVLSKEDVDKRLGIKEHFLQSRDVVSKKRHEEILMVTKFLSKEDKVALQNVFDSIAYSYRKELEETKKELDEELIIEKELCRVIQHCDTELLHDDKLSFIVVIKGFNDHGLGVLYDVSRRLEPELRKKFSKRLEADNTAIKRILTSLKLDKYYKVKTVTDEIKEYLYKTQ